jgi:hypothetical protein
VEKLARRLVTALNPFFQIQSLQRFNAKFDPEWLPRVLAFRRPTDLPKVGLLYAAAEGFLAVPLIGDLLVPRAVGGVSRPVGRGYLGRPMPASGGVVSPGSPGEWAALG